MNATLRVANTIRHQLGGEYSRSCVGMHPAAYMHAGVLETRRDYR